MVLGTNSYFDICVGFALGAAIGIFTAANLSGKIFLFTKMPVILKFPIVENRVENFIQEPI